VSMQFTETAISRLAREAVARGERIEQRDPGFPGLELRIGKSGTRTWTLRCRDASGRLRTFQVGRHPDMGLSEARAAARRLRVAVEDGADPTVERRNFRSRGVPNPEPHEVTTLKLVLDTYEARRGNSLKSWAHSRKRVDRVFAGLMAKPITALTPIDLQIAADRYPAKQSAAFAVRTLRPALRWIARRGLAPMELVNIYQPVTVNRRRRVLNPAELGELLPIVMLADRPHAALFYFLLLTLARREEAAAAHWRDVDLERKIWRIPDTKNGEPHEVPLSRQAIDLLRQCRPAEPDLDTLVFSTSLGTRLGNWDRETKRIQRESGVAGWNRHDLRRTGATMLGEMGVLPDIIEAALNHVTIRSPLAATYNRSRYRPQVAMALQRLADALDSIAAGTVPLFT
jgi:integrase